MDNLIVNASTILKQSTGQASGLGQAAKRTLAAGSYKILDCKPSAAGHYVVKFPEPIAANDGKAKYQSWWVYGDDRVTLPTASTINTLPVVYASQLDNKNQPQRTCNTSCHWMLLSYLKPGFLKSDDDYWLKHVQPYGDSVDNNLHTKALARHGIQSNWQYNLDFADLYKQIDLGFPVPIGIAHRGPQAAPIGGHIILVIGYSSSNFICHDPFGKLPYSDWSSGKGVFYSAEMIGARWLLEGKKSGWGRIVL